MSTNDLYENFEAKDGSGTADNDSWLLSYVDLLLLMVQEKKHPLIVNDVLEPYLNLENIQAKQAPKNFLSKMLPVVTAHVD